ncbi:asparagine synthetase domain-containing protein CG17486 [Topomyia yanbarensis]|uniref:asparagine synthetase domain-containing protein CG17486 n=1 Tax=Topomyia yanbarensis TaxID=2498891 RepID=UPI00273AB82C|nr:asparagine synthetase domain-containing protein CG17486 [Topomyia yanbarensis]
MCGIFCFISRTDSIEVGKNVLELCKCLLNNRGPNKSGRSIHGSDVVAYGSVLWQQGTVLCSQPIQNDRFVLLFNGDLYIVRNDPNVSDTQWLFEKIVQSMETDTLHELITHLKGPFSMILLDKKLGRVYFARDSLGRNSLLLGQNDEGIIISSVLGKIISFEIDEVPPNGIYYMDFLNNTMQRNLMPWIDNVKEGCFLTILNEKFINLSWFDNTTVHKVDFNYHRLLKNVDLPPENVFDMLLSNESISSMCEELIEFLSQSVRERTTNTPPYCKQCIDTEALCPHSRVGILFSGGIDCTIIALLADQFVNQDIPIDLLNVAFERVVRCGNRKDEINWDVPDRLTGRATLKELQSLRPQRKWQFVEIDVTREELNNHRLKISELVFPLKSVLDESLGAALWFASRGEGTLNEAVYKSQCRVLLVGSGADELFGGYTRHRAAFYRNLNSKDHQHKDEEIELAFRNLAAELEHDWNRLPSRNLARDDRMICDHGITPRAPYLQEDFIAVVRSLKSYQKCYHPLGAGVGDKLTLRLCGYKLGLKTSPMLRKRALQFGCRIADSKQNANDVSIFLNRQIKDSVPS